MARAGRAAVADDGLEGALEAAAKFAEILRPEDVDEPILAPSVAHAVHEWLVEVNWAAELKAAKIQPRRLALLYGPPGTGKTTLAHHVAARLGMPLIAVQSERIVDAYVGSTGRNLGALFDILKPIEARCVLLLDEFDALANKRKNKSGADDERTQFLTVLLRRIEFYSGIGLAATNTRETLDPAMWRRFGLQISVDLPGEDERFAILRKYAAPFDLDDEAIDVFVGITRGCSPSLLRQLMEGMKRTLILAPRLRIDVSRAEQVFLHITSSIAPPPEMQQPPLWSETEKSLDKLNGIAWPPRRAE